VSLVRMWSQLAEAGLPVQRLESSVCVCVSSPHVSAAMVGRERCYWRFGPASWTRVLVPATVYQRQCVPTGVGATGDRVASVGRHNGQLERGCSPTVI